ncbi:MaoC family dehydratase [Nocardioides sp. Bht2]|uniref:MaoC family dehydratase n=1 Tax=Nocardioides sp. Bht2 TaxID=3392297 RepID=UPI0039B404E4
MSAHSPVDLHQIRPLISGQTFQEMTPGSTFRTASRTVTESDLVSFTALAGLNEPLFYDEAASREAGYGGRLIPGALTFSYAEGLVMQSGVIHGTGMAFLSADVKVHAPVLVGDTITVVVEVLEARPTSDGKRGVVTTRNTVVGRDGVAVMTYEPVRMIRGVATPDN